MCYMGTILMKKVQVEKPRSWRIPPWSIGLLMGTIFLAAGLWQDQFADIYRKAVMICLECIGIG